MDLQNHSKIRVFYWNARSIIQRKSELEKILENIDVFVCVESWLKPANTFKCTGFEAFRKDRCNSTGGGILYLIRKNLKFTELSNIRSQSEKKEITGIRITNSSPNIDIIACYRIPSFTLTQTEWNLITSTITNNNNSVLLGDFNAHNKKWNCKKTDVNGDRLDHSIEINNLFLHNVDTYTHVDIRSGNKSNIDLAISSTDFADKIHFEVLDENFGSDHFPILLNIDASRHKHEKKTFKLKSLKTNWEKFNSLLEVSYDQFLDHEYDQLPPSRKYEFLVQTISESLKKATPRKKKNLSEGKKILNPVPWWDTDCNKIKRLRQASYKKHIKLKSI